MPLASQDHLKWRQVKEEGEESWKGHELNHRERKEMEREKLLWGCRIVWCIFTSRYLVSPLPVSIIHVSDIFRVGFWSWGISFIMWGCRGWGWQAAGTWVLVSVKWWDSPPSSCDLEPANQYTPSKKPAGELKSQRAPKFEQKPTPFVPIELL